MTLRTMLFTLLLVGAAATADVRIASDPAASPRVQYGVAKLAETFHSAGIEGGQVVGKTAAAAPERFTLVSSREGTIIITGGDDSGARYGGLELADRVRRAKK